MDSTSKPYGAYKAFSRGFLVMKTGTFIFLNSAGIT